MAQTSITEFFSKRKRTAEDNTTKNKNKVIILDSSSSARIYSQIPLKESVCTKKGGPRLDSEQNETLPETGPCAINKRLIFTESISSGSKTTTAIKPKGPRNTNNRRKAGSKTSKAHNNCDIRGALNQKHNYELPCTSLGATQHNEHVQETNKLVAEEITEKQVSKRSSVQSSVVFQLRGPLSPEKIRNIQTNQNLTPTNSNSITKTACSAAENANEKKQLGLTTPVKKNVQLMSPDKDLHLTDIQAKVSRSAKLEELKRSLANFSKGAEKLKEIEKKKKDLGNPQIQKFEAIELEIPLSPQKSIYNSPQKVIYSSPQKECSSSKSTPSKSPAYKRFASLAQPITTALTLPYSYRCIAEIFRAVDTVASMMYNRKEVITFKKLKPAVQEMLRRNFTEKHLAQIKRVLPMAYDFKQEKVKNFGLNGKHSDYNLTLTPLAIQAAEDGCSKSDSNSDVNTSKYVSITPSVLLERRQAFQKSLLEKTKDFHEEFLRSQDPPLEIPRENLTRWHPDFEVDLVPDIEPEELPQAPNADKFSSAKDVLERAKSMFNHNIRLYTALETLSADNMSPNAKSDGIVQANQASSAVISGPSILKGIPKALLEKVRARQAAKAMEAMTRTSAEDHEAICLMRLPEIARILRNIYVTEKKSVLCLDVALEKLENSYREKLSIAELQEHIQLLMKTVPGWLTIHTMRKTDFLKLSKHGDVNLVIKKLEQVAAEKNNR